MPASESPPSGQKHRKLLVICFEKWLENVEAESGIKNMLAQSSRREAAPVEVQVSEKVWSSISIASRQGLKRIWSSECRHGSSEMQNITQTRRRQPFEHSVERSEVKQSMYEVGFGVNIV